MAKDKDRDLIDRIDSAISEEIHNTLEKLLIIHLKPILETLEQLNAQVNNIEKRLERTEQRLDTIEKEQKRQGKELKKLQKTLDLAIKVFNREDMRIYKRVKRIEEHLGLPRFE